jgi:hypothetical protein
MTKFITTLICALGAAAAGSACASETPPPRTVAPPARIPDPVAPQARPEGQPVAIASLPRELRRAVAEDAARRFGVGSNDVVLSNAEQVAWPDGSLGCPEPGQMYTQMIVPGYRLVASTTRGKLAYHTDQGERVIACADRQLSGPKGPQIPPKPVEPRTDPAAPSADR